MDNLIRELYYMTDEHWANDGGRLNTLPLVFQSQQIIC